LGPHPGRRRRARHPGFRARAQPGLRRPAGPGAGERRLELSKAAHKYAEGAKIAVRGVRRDGMDTTKAMEKKGTIGQDEEKRWGEDIQKLTDQYIKKIDDSLADKDREIKQV
jgi:ribosome recycling factor